MTVAAFSRSASVGRLDPLDTALVVLFLLGIYLGVSLQVSEKVPLTCAPSGLAGIIMLWRRRDQLDPRHLGGLLAVIAVYLASIMSADDYAYLGKRFTGLLQITYSLVIGYAMFVTLVHGERRQIARILLTFCLFIIVGCLLETYAGLRPLSDAVRERIYDSAVVYDSDLRDVVLYGRIRPKLFTSEPSAVTFSYTHFASVWLVVSPWRWKVPVYLGLIGCALFVLPGPTLVLMLLLTIPYIIFLAGRGTGRPSAMRTVGALAISGLLLALAIVLGQIFFAERLNELASGRDASFFYRFTGPMLVALNIFQHHPWAGSGLTGEPSIADLVLNVYMNSPSFQAAWSITRIGDVLTNYFWLHWIYLGLVWGVVALVAMSTWLRMLGVPSVLYCWAVWLILGQASGSYVGPKTWAVLLIAAAASILRVGGRTQKPVPTPAPPPASRPRVRFANAPAGYLGS